MDLPEPEHDEALKVVVDNLVDYFPTLDREVIVAIAREEYDALAAASKAPSFVGILAERQARDRLAAMA